MLFVPTGSCTGQIGEQKLRLKKQEWMGWIGRFWSQRGSSGPMASPSVRRYLKAAFLFRNSVTLLTTNVFKSSNVVKAEKQTLEKSWKDNRLKRNNFMENKAYQPWNERHEKVVLAVTWTGHHYKGVRHELKYKKRVRKTIEASKI